MTRATLDTIYIPQPSVMTNEVADELVLVNMQTGLYHGLDAVGARVWEALDGQRTLAEVAAEVARHYPEVEPERIEADIVTLTQELLDHALVATR